MKKAKGLFKLPMCMLVKGTLHCLMLLSSAVDFSLNLFVVINVEFSLHLSALQNQIECSKNL